MIEEGKIDCRIVYAYLFVGALLLTILLLDSITSIDIVLDKQERIIIIATVIGVFLGGLSSRVFLHNIGQHVFGKIGKLSFSLGGPSAIVFIVYFSLMYTLDVSDSPTFVMVGRISGAPFPEDIRTIEVKDGNNARLYGYFRRFEKDFTVRIEDKNLKVGCLTFVLVMEDDYKIIMVHPQTLRRLYRNIGQFLALVYREHNGNPKLLSIDENIHARISSQENYCTTVTSDHVSVKSSYMAFFIEQAYAQAESEISDENLVDALQSDDVLIRYEAQEILSTRQPEVIISIIEYISRDDITIDKRQYLAVGLIRIIEGMLQKGIEPREIREKLANEKNLKLFVDMLNHPDPILRYDALASLMRLRDPRIYPYLKEILESKEDDARKYNAALVLIETFPKFSEKIQLEISNSIKAGNYNSDLKVKELLPRIKRFIFISIDNGSQLQNSPIGWVYVGMNFGEMWEEKYFEWNDDSNVPKKGDVLTANGSVNLRADHIRYDWDIKQWVNADIVGLIRPGDEVEVTDVENVADGFYWVEIKRAD